MLFGNVKKELVNRGAMRVIVTRAVAFADSDGVHDESDAETDTLNEYGEPTAHDHERLYNNVALPEGSTAERPSWPVNTFSERRPLAWGTLMRVIL